MAKKTVKDFIEFLKKNKVYRQFKDNIENNSNRNNRKIEMFLKECEDSDRMSDVVGEGFIWADTDRQEQGFDFWNSIEVEWQKLFYGK